MIGLTFST